MEITVKIATRELKYAIKNKTYITARSMEATGKMPSEAVSHMQASEDYENAYELSRAITSAIAEVKEELSEYLESDESKNDNLVNSLVEEGEPITFKFDMPSNYDKSSVEALITGIHDYVVCRSIYEWYRETCPELAAACKTDAADAMIRAKKSMYKRTRPVRG